MPDRKITQLDALITPTYVDLLAIVGDPLGTPVTQKITRQDLLGLLFKVLTADAAVTDGTAVQPWFPTAGAVTVQAASTYRMDGGLLLANGITSHDTALAFGGTATLTSVAYIVRSHRAAVGTHAVNVRAAHITTAAATVVTAAGTEAGLGLHLVGLIRINAAGTLIPQFQWSAAPGGTNQVLANSWFRLERLGSNTVASLGSWA